jgi:hypothetical protein
MNEYDRFLREIKDDEAKKWKPQKESIAIGLIEAFLSSKMVMAEIKLEELPEPERKDESKVKSTKQDTFASSFYAWKRKTQTQDRLRELGIDIILIRRGEKVALRRVEKR